MKMIFYLLFYLLLIIIYTSSINPLNYIHHQFNGKIKQSTWNISVFINDSRGIVLYALDSDDKYVVEIGLDPIGVPTIIIQFNDDKKIVNLPSLCECRKCKLKHLNFITKLGEGKISIKCNNKSDKIMILHSMTNNTDTYKRLPIPKNFKRNVEKIFIWMGNIGLYEGYNNITYQPRKEQLIGCLEYFYVNNQRLKINKIENQFKSSCISNILNETIHHHDKQYNIVKSVNMFDCSLSFINEKYCDKIEMSVYSQINQSYVRHEITDKSIAILLAWKQIFSKNYCLIEINLRNGFNISFKIDSTNRIMLEMFKNASDNNSKGKLLNKISLDIINYLFIQFDENNFIVKISNGHQLDTFIYDKLNEPFMINIGHSNKSNQCETFEGLFGFKYNSSQFKINLPKQTDNNQNDNYLVKKTIGVAIGVSISFIVSVMICYSKLTKKIDSQFASLEAEQSPSRAYEIHNHIESISLPIIDNNKSVHFKF